MSDLFPIFLKLDGRRCLVVGGGPVAEQKLEGLLAAGAQVHLVAPAITHGIRRLADEGKLVHHDRPFAEADLEGVDLVIAATGDPRVNGAVFQAAERRHILCNAVDEPDHCHFYYPAVVRRGQLQIAISTAGQSPALAQRLRHELEAAFGPEYAAWLQWLGRVRSLLFQRRVAPEPRKAALHRIAGRDVYERFARARQRRRGETR